MTFYEVLKTGENMLSNGNIENSSFDARSIFSYVYKMDRKEYMLSSGTSCEDTERFFDLINKRLSGYPLQYILGEWDFMSCTFKVGKGVLIPRQDTELLVEKAVEFIKKNDVKTVFDLCSGSGCIGISVAKAFPEIQVYCVEMSEEALKYLEKNVSLNKADNIKVIRGDIKKGFEYFDLPRPDMILSNPPYIKSSEIPVLQKEVLFEPAMALDGGCDGLDFYRELFGKWTAYLNDNGCAMLECGEDQAKEIEEIFKNNFNTEIFRDYNNIQRLVVLYKTE